MNTVAELTGLTTLELDRKRAALQATFDANSKELARASHADAKKNMAILRYLHDQIFALDIDTKQKRSMTNTCLQMIEANIKSKQFNMVLTETDIAFLSKLEKKHPALNPRELKICLLIKLDYGTMMIAHISGITKRGMESIRFRTHHKLGIGRYDSLKSYLCKLAVA